MNLSVQALSFYAKLLYGKFKNHGASELIVIVLGNMNNHILGDSRQGLFHEIWTSKIRSN